MRKSNYRSQYQPPYKTNDDDEIPAFIDWFIIKTSPHKPEYVEWEKKHAKFLKASVTVLIDFMDDYDVKLHIDEGRIEFDNPGINFKFNYEIGRRIYWESIWGDYSNMIDFVKPIDPSMHECYGACITSSGTEQIWVNKNNDTFGEGYRDFQVRSPLHHLKNPVVIVDGVPEYYIFDTLITKSDLDIVTAPIYAYCNQSTTKK